MASNELSMYSDVALARRYCVRAFRFHFGLAQPCHPGTLRVALMPAPTTNVYWNARSRSQSTSRAVMNCWTTLNREMSHAKAQRRKALPRF